jgi:FKBP-type peptidyl-prolyl cis-trans isomerase FklB
MRTKTHRDALVLLLCTLALAGGGRAEEPVPIQDPVGRASYSLGHQVGSDLLREGREIDPDALRRGLTEGLEGGSPALDPEVMGRLLVGLKQGIVATERRQRRDRTARKRLEAEAFLAENAKQPGIVALTSGLQYRIQRAGTGRKPGPAATVVVHYRSTTMDGSVVHDSRKNGGEPETLALRNVVPGLGAALQLMQEGARWELYLPPDLAYGRRGPLADRAVIMDVELISIEGEP